METLSRMPKNANLEKYGLKNVKANWNLDGETLQKLTVEKGMGTETENGTLCVNTGKFTGRSPKDRFIVKDDYTADKVWWGRINKPIDSANFNKLYDEVANYLSDTEVYVRDAYVGAAPEYRMNVRTITEYPWSNYFVKNMFIQLNDDEIENFEEEWVVLCAPGFVAKDPEASGIRAGN
ncbi:phosphoenolpyruvate carboxykinase (ATP), partial [Zobellia laminariae]|uniref:phosphoenolpyruvate carboxykinase (ATP) n=1 Tax=Zobellia laminariae TaxID=248906 RepID=UPI004056F06E